MGGSTAQTKWTGLKMAHALNLTLKIRQDATAKATLAQIKADFATKIQPAIDAALRESEIVHFARVLVIDDLYLQVITEYDGDHAAYTDFFRLKLPQVFGLLFSLAEQPIDRSALGDSNAFFEFSKKLQVRSLGDASDGDTDGEGNVAGYLFSAYGNREVREIKASLNG
jgi:hypothetical protein